MWRSCWPERGLHADHVTVWRWVQRYAPEMERRLRRRLKPTCDSWRVEETYIRVKGKWVYLYRAVDSTGATIEFLLSAKFQLDIVSFFDIDFERPAEVLAERCAGCASRLDRGVEILIHN
jgi:DDE superfamily endonuclease